MRHATLLLDLDPQASATKAIGVDIGQRPTMADVLLEPTRFTLREVVVTTGWGFDLAPAETALASREARRMPTDEFILRRQLEDVDRYQAMLIDCPPSLGVLTIKERVARPRARQPAERRCDAAQRVGQRPPLERLGDQGPLGLRAGVLREA